MVTNASEGKYSLAIDMDKTTPEQKGFISREGSFDFRKFRK